MTAVTQCGIKETYENNLGMLTQWLKESVETISERELWEKIEVKYNDDDLPVCIYRQGDKRFQIASEKPLQEMKTWREANPDMEGSGAVFLYGCGFGYPIFEMFAHKKAHTLVIVFEEDLYLFKAMLYYFDLRPLIESGKIVFLIGDPEYYAAAFEQLFFSIFFISCTYPAVVYTFAAQRNFKEPYIRIHRDVFSKLSLMVFYIGNDHKDNLLGFINIMDNIKEIAQNPYISCLKDKYRGFPAFIVANGPSLDKNIERLKDIQGKGLIICVESAIITLLKNGIKPDIIVVIERIKASYVFHFRDTSYPDDISLLGLALIDRRVFSSFPGERIPILRDREVVNRWVGEYLGDGSVIDAGANVSHLAAELAVYMGAEPVVFVGQDYAYGQDNLTHSRDSVYSEIKGREAREHILSSPAVYLRGNDGTMIRSNELWADFKKGMEMKIADHPGTTFLNATEGGARIFGTECIRLGEAIQKYCAKPIPGRVNDLIRQSREKISVAERNKCVKELMISIDHLTQAFRDMATESAKGRLRCKGIMRLLEKNENGQYNDGLEKAYQNNIEIFNRFIMDAMFRCFTQQVVFANYYYINRLKFIDTPEKIAEVFRIHYNFFSQLHVVCQSVSVHMENALESLKTDYWHEESKETQGEET